MNIKKIIFFFLFCLLNNLAISETIPATLSVSGGYTSSRFSGVLGWTAATTAIINSVLAQYPGFVMTHTSQETEPNLPAGSSVGYEVGIRNNQSGASHVINTPMNKAVFYECPANQNWTLSGQTCTRPDCQLGYDRNSSGVCVKDCTGKAGQPTPSPSYQFPNGGFPSVGGCMVRCATNRQAGGGTSLVPLTLVGDSCTYTGTSAEGDMNTEGVGFKPEPKAPKTPADCIGSGMGYIQGSTGTTCVASSDAPAGQKPETSHKGGEESGKTGPDGKPDPNAPDYNKKEKDTQNKDGKTTETTEETTKGTPDGSGGTTCPEGFTLVPGTTNCTKSTTTTKDTSDYCAENPKSPVCKGTEEADACIENPDRIGCVDMGAVPTTDPLREEERGVSIITPVQLAEIHSCPQGVTLPKGIGSFNWEPMCDFASALKPVILAIAWLSAFFIVMGFSQSED